MRKGEVTDGEPLVVISPKNENKQRMEIYWKLSGRGELGGRTRHGFFHP